MTTFPIEETNIDLFQQAATLIREVDVPFRIDPMIYIGRSNFGY